MRINCLMKSCHINRYRGQKETYHWQKVSEDKRYRVPNLYRYFAGMGENMLEVPTGKWFAFNGNSETYKCYISACASEDSVGHLHVIDGTLNSRNYIANIIHWQILLSTRNPFPDNSSFFTGVFICLPHCTNMQTIVNGQ